MKWISVKDRLPKKNVEVFIACKDAYNGIAIKRAYLSYDVFEQHISGNGTTIYVNVEGVTHWMPLPQPPKED